MSAKNSYDDIINLPHPISKKHPRMSRENRAAQFSPFAALTGYDAAVSETARYTEARREADEQGLALLDEKLRILQEHISSHPQVDIMFFQADLLKEGGHYSNHSGELLRIEPYADLMIFSDGFSIEKSAICEIDSPIFNQFKST